MMTFLLFDWTTADGQRKKGEPKGIRFAAHEGWCRWKACLLGEENETCAPYARYNYCLLVSIAWFKKRECRDPLDIFDCNIVHLYALLIILILLYNGKCYYVLKFQIFKFTYCR